MALGSALISIMFYRMQAANKVNQNGFLDLPQVEVGRFFSPKTVKLHLLNCVLVEMRVCAINQWSALILAPLISLNPSSAYMLQGKYSTKAFLCFMNEYMYQTVKID